MIRLVLPVALLLSTAAHAQQCSAALQAEWAQVTLRNQKSVEVLRRAQTTGSVPDRASECVRAQNAAEIYRMARVYFPACDPQGGSRVLPELERHAARSAAFSARNCR